MKFRQSYCKNKMVHFFASHGRLIDCNPQDPSIRTQLWSVCKFPYLLSGTRKYQIFPCSISLSNCITFVQPSIFTTLHGMRSLCDSWASCYLTYIAGEKCQKGLNLLCIPSLLALHGVLTRVPCYICTEH